MMRRIIAPLASGFLLFLTSVCSALAQEYPVMTIEVIPGALPFSGFVVLLLTFISAFLWYKGANQVGGAIGKFLRILLVGLLVISINISFGDFWSPIYLGNPFIEDMEVLVEVIGFMIIAFSAWVIFKDLNPRKGLSK